MNMTDFIKSVFSRNPSDQTKTAGVSYRPDYVEFLERENDRLNNECMTRTEESEEVQRILRKALRNSSFSKSESDFPETGMDDVVSIGEPVALNIAMNAAQRIKRLEIAVKENASVARLIARRQELLGLGADDEEVNGMM